MLGNVQPAKLGLEKARQADKPSSTSAFSFRVQHTLKLVGDPASILCCSSQRETQVKACRSVVADSVSAGCSFSSLSKGRYTLLVMGRVHRP